VHVIVVEGAAAPFRRLRPWRLLPRAIPRRQGYSPPGRQEKLPGTRWLEYAAMKRNTDDCHGPVSLQQAHHRQGAGYAVAVCSDIALFWTCLTMAADDAHRLMPTPRVGAARTPRC